MEDLDSGLYYMARKNPKAFLLGLLCALLGIVIYYYSNTKDIYATIEFYQNDSDCCVCLNAPRAILTVFYVLLCAMGGFVLGYSIGKIFFRP
jgi:hypothetical protein